MKFAFVARCSPSDQLYYSGTAYNMYQGFAAQTPIIHIERPILNPNSFERLFQKTYEMLTRKRLILIFENALIRREARILTEKLKQSGADCFISSELLSFAGIDGIRQVCWIDGTCAMREQMGYPHVLNRSKRSNRKHLTVEIQALKCDSITLCTSKECYKSLRNDYALGHRCEILPYGSNIRDFISDDRLKAKIASCLNGCTINILMIGAAWERKNGPLFLEILERLADRKLNVRGHFIGNAPKEVISNNFVTVHGFLKKDDPGDYAKIIQILSECHLHLLPTKADLSPVVINEAAAFGIPTISTEVGGIPSLITDGQNGCLVDRNSEAEIYGSKIEILIQNPNLLAEMMKNSFDIYKRERNWDQNCKRALELVSQGVSKPPS